MAGYFGIGIEGSTWATPATPTIFVPVLSSTHTSSEGFLRDEGIRGRRTRSVGVPGAKTASGTVESHLYNEPFSKLLKLCFGTVNTTGSGPYTHVASAGAQTGAGKSATLQTVITDVTNTDRPFTAVGAKITEWEVSVSARELAKLTFSWVGKDVVTNIAAASATFSSELRPYRFSECVVYLPGGATPTPLATATSLTLRASKSLATERFHLGSRYIAEPIDLGHWDITASIAAEFDGLTAYNAAIAGTELAVEIAFANDEGDSLTFEGNAQVTNAAPSLTGTGLESYTIEVEFGSEVSDAATLQATLVNGESSA